MDDDSIQFIACIPRLRRYARALAGNRAEADDLVQDTMERGWRKLASWRRGGDMRAWLFGIMHNLYVDQARKARIATEELDDHLPDPSADTAQADRLEVRDMEAALRLLPAEQREILLLVALEEMTYEEISIAVQIPVGTVMSRLSRGRERLRALMQGRSVSSPLKVVK
jgi:RNA polymerase sigma-70 factor (ECF subfamily)